MWTVKRKVSYILFLIFVGFFPALSAQAQTYKAVSFPKKYAKPSGKMDYTEEGNDTLSRSGRIWFVCSDRNNNNTYKKPGGKKVKEVLNFLDKFYVIGEEGEYLRLAKGRTDNMNDDIIDQEEEIFINGIDYGWIHKNNLLLWRSCLVGDKKIDTKAMLLNTIEGINYDNISVKELEEVAFYQEPSLTVGSGNSARLFEFFFVYKRQGNSILLGKDNYIKNYYSDFNDIIVGWVSAKKVIQWNHRVVAERNWEERAVRERLSKGTKATVFYEKFNAETYKKGYSVNDLHILWQENEISKIRDPGQRKRFPILNEIKKNEMKHLLEIGAMGQIYNYDGMTINREDYEDLIHEASRSKKEKRNINIVFVVDGTKGMSQYCKSISKAVENSAKYFKTSLNTIKFGAVVYRDKEAGPIVQRKHLNTDSKAIIDFFNREVNTNYEDRDVGDAVYHGVHTAINSLSLNKNETNLIVLISGAPNNNRIDETQVKEEELIQLMYDFDCHLFAFLVNNTSDEHEEFIYQVRNLVIGVAEKKYKKLKNEPKIQEFIKKKPEYLQKPRLIPYPKKQNMYKLERTAMMGSIYNAEYGMELDLGSFQQELTKVLKQTDIQTNQFLNRIEYKIWGIGNDDSGEGTADAANFGASFLNFLLRSGLSEEQILKIRDDNIQLYQPGYTPEFIDGHQYPLFKPSLFLTRDELFELYKQMKKFSEATHSVNNARKEMQQVWLDVLKGHIGSDEESFLREQGISDLLEMDLLSINEKVHGLPGKSSFLEKVKLADITKTDRFSDKQFNIFSARIETKLHELSPIVNGNDYPYSFQSNDINYYWISEDFIP